MTLVKKNPSIKKRSYSRAGCDECKRRKMKCDETKPHCFNCTRLNKLCIYLVKPKFRFEKTEGPNDLKMVAELSPAGFHKFKSVPIKDLKKYSKGNHQSLYESSLLKDQQGFQASNGLPVRANAPQLVSKSSTAVAVSQVPQTLPVSQIVHPSLVQVPFQVGVNEDGNSLGSGSNLSIDDWKQLLDEAKVLVHDINDVSQIEDYSMPKDDFTEQLAYHPNTIDLNQFITPSLLAIPTDDDLSMTNTELIDRIIDHHGLKEPHVTYLKTLSTTNLSYHMFPFASSIESNEVVKLLLKYLHTCDYLLSSLLAISATFQFNQTGTKTHDTSRQEYTTLCLKLLNKAFSEHGVGSIMKHMIAMDIERLLLTVIILTSIFTSTSAIDKTNVMDSWKLHLKGARDLLVNYGELANSSYITSGLALAQTWFFSIESIAGLYSPNGGTLLDAKVNANTKDYLKKWFKTIAYFSELHNPAYHSALSRISMLTNLDHKHPNLQEFNLFCGFTILIVQLIEELISVLEFVRNNPNIQISPDRIAKVMSLIHLCYTTEIAPSFCRKTFVIPKYSPAHPEYTLSENKIHLPSSAYVKIDDNYCSWFDLSEQIRTDSMYLRFITTPGLLGLTREHPLVKLLVLKIINSFIFLKSKNSPSYEVDKSKVLIETANFYLSTESFDNRAIMIQSPFRLCSKLVDDNLDFEKLELFFLGLVKLGNGSALSALDLLYKYKTNWRTGISSIKNEGDRIGNSLDSNDAELEIIPFS